MSKQYNSKSKPLPNKPKQGSYARMEAAKREKKEREKRILETTSLGELIR